MSLPFLHPKKHDFAPRFGVAWHPRTNLVVRAGAGIFYDLGYSDVANGMTGFPYAQQKILAPVPPAPPLSFPLSDSDAAPPVFTTSPPVPYLAVVDPSHVLPRTYEWNAAVEQTLGKAEVLTLTYVGAGGRKLMRQDVYNAPNSDFIGEFDLMRNGATSSYQALQTQFRHRLSHGLQTLLSYTWAHSIDDVSSDVYFANVPPVGSPSPGERGSSDNDIRHTFSSAVSYDIPSPAGGIWKTIFGRWSTDSIFYVRSAPTVNVVTGQDPFGGFLSGAFGVQRPDVVPGVPFYLHDANAPGEKVINAAAFISPPAEVQGNLGRNALRGFGATQLDLTLRRRFRFTERIALQARADFFNIFNHPNFGNPVNYLSNTAQFGEATKTLAGYLGSGGQGGGLNPLYQIGGPRSIQLALKLVF